MFGPKGANPNVNSVLQHTANKQMKESETQKFGLQDLHLRPESFIDVVKDTTKFEAFAWDRRL
jgi:hypothetical protein